MAEKNVELKGYQAEACEAQGNENSVVCGKRKDHNVFIPVSDFSVHHLPERYRDGDIVSTTQALARLVVSLLIPVEDKLPVTEPCPHSLESFEACESKEIRKATARVKYVEMVREADNKVCQCPECMYRADEDKETEFSNVVIVTSTHNVCDVDMLNVFLTMMIWGMHR
ncbi:uncharacterized protein LOC131933795 [Physella acuta]|uniref:uncharacterized protein LOC131933795 n=1 Tax=Physella acuta TaxID=109671 RepID=UPI0027DD9818|nr:uncharacterized protein LOC131933795 [Physella acuta]